MAPTLSGSRRFMVASGKIAPRNGTPFSAHRSTPDAKLGAVEPAVFLRMAEAFTERLLAPRRKYLNGKRASRYVDALRRDIGSRKVDPMKMVLAVALEDAQDPDMPVTVVADVFEGIAKLLRAVAKGASHDRELGIVSPSRLELLMPASDREHAENVAELALDLNSIASIDALLEASALEREAEDMRNDQLRARRAELLARAVLTPTPKEG